MSLPAPRTCQPVPPAAGQTAASRRPPGRAEYEEHALRAEPAVQGRLLDVQELDSRLDQLAHRRDILPERAEAERLGARAGELRDELVVAETEYADLERDQRKAEADVEQVRARARRDRERLDTGQVGSAKELQSLQHELESLARRQTELEDIELEVMERLEAAQTQRTQTRAAQESLTSEVADVTARRDAAFTAIDAETDGLRRERTAVAATVPDELLALYESLRARNGGVGAAALRQGRCQGCRLELTAQERDRIRTAPADEVLRCEECRRILVRVPDSGL